MSSRSSRRQPATPSSRKGLFKDGQWLCDCRPRLPASSFEVKKESKNKGRWFYTCQHSDDKRCKFFLWKDEADRRQERALLNNSRSEVDTADADTAPGPAQPGRGRPESSPPPPYTEVDKDRPSSTASRKRRSSDSDDDPFPWPLSGDEESELLRSSGSRMPPPETPRKTMKTAMFDTPGSRVDRGHDFGDFAPTTATRTPQSHQSMPRASGMGESFHTPGSSSIRGQSSGVTNSPATPTPSRYRDTSVGIGEDSNLMEEVKDLLRSKNVRPAGETGSGLKQILSRHSLRMQGIAKGRDVARLGMKAKDAKIAELQLRIATLEAELETERATAQHLRWQIETGETEGL